MNARVLKVVCCALAAQASSSAFGQVLYSQDFDVNDSANWTIAPGSTTDVSAEFFFDYSQLGIPSAPNSNGGSTRGMRLRANINAAAVGGITVTPNGQSFTGDYAVTFDLWSNFLGDASAANALLYGGPGSTHFSTYGIMSSGGQNYLDGTVGGVAEALFFANSGDGQQTYDYRVHGPGKPEGYRGTTETAYDPVADAGVTFADTYPEGHPAEGTTNRGVDDDPVDGFLYIDAFPPVSVPDQAAITNTGSELGFLDLSATQFGETMAGAMGMAWREIEIKKVGDIVTWSVLNTAIGDQVFATVDLGVIQNPTGTNIMFGHSDLFDGTSNDINYPQMQFTLIDNVNVEAAAAPVDDADFDGDGDVDGADFLTWQRNLGPGNQGQGDADGNGTIDGADLTVWKAQFGATPGASAVASVPEPSTWLLGLLASAGLGAGRAARRGGGSTSVFLYSFFERPDRGMAGRPALIT